MNHVHSEAALQRVGSVATADLIITSSTVGRVLAATAAQRVLAAATIDPVLAIAAVRLYRHEHGIIDRNRIVAVTAADHQLVDWRQYIQCGTACNLVAIDCDEQITRLVA